MTQGVVSVVQGGAVRLKIIAGCDGMHADQVAAAIKRTGRVPTLEEAYRLASQHGFGSVEDRVVMDEHGVKFDGDEELDPRYRQTFADPRFNPRWDHGTADFVEVVEL